MAENNNQCPYPTNNLYPSLNSLEHQVNQPYQYVQQDNSTSKYATATPPEIKPRRGKAPAAPIAQVEAGKGYDVKPLQQHEYLMRKEIARRQEEEAIKLAHQANKLSLKSNPSAPSEAEVAQDIYGKPGSANNPISNSGSGDTLAPGAVPYWQQPDGGSGSRTPNPNNSGSDASTSGPSEEAIAKAMGKLYGNSQLSQNLLQIANAQSLHIYHTKKGHGKMGFEIKPDGKKFIALQGSEDANMLNGFSLKVLTLGIVNTKFSISLHAGETKCFEIYRPIGSSEYIEIYFTPDGSRPWEEAKIKIGYVRPTSINLTRIQYAIHDSNKIEVGRMSSSALRGLFNDNFEYVTKKKEKGCKLQKNGLLTFTNTGCGFDIHMKLLCLAASILIKFNI
jgi:hypothetical protein